MRASKLPLIRSTCFVRVSLIEHAADGVRDIGCDGVREEGWL